MVNSGASPRTNSTAVVAFAASVASFVCLWGIGGVLGIVLGLLARGQIERAGRLERGARLATAAIVLGVVHLACWIVAVGVTLALMFRPEPPIALLPHGSPPSATAAPPGVAWPPRGVRSGPRVSSERRFGSVTLVEIGSESGPLRAVLDAEWRKARASGAPAIAFIVTSDCPPCAAVRASLRDERLQAALGSTRLLELDAYQFGSELELLGIPTESVPGFALLTEGARPVDYLHGGEWDADVPENIAPVLRDFVRGSRRARRYPWRGIPRPDETTL
ncbi:MAG TPA: DUF4190 domain-containing protein [Polyangiaceae bacterium]|nr:DUF4190 domain-containing protein [Polyangiaceae bacterium]